MSPLPNPLHLPTDSQISSADRFASPVHSPVSPVYKSTRSSTRSSLARQLDDVEDKPKSPAHSKDGKDGKDGGGLSPAFAKPRQSSRDQTKPSKKAASPLKRELRPRGHINSKGAVRKAGRAAKVVPAKTVPAQRKGRPAKKSKESKATVSAQAADRNEWEVEKIVDSRIEEETLQHFFRVKWKGFSDKHNTWEPKKNLANCKGLVDAYEKKAGKQ
ncbi:uncharacterized protein TRIVIDRAFT_225073 [Trichoderma virens Gv29-8]|uniref:Chromo domain-containing protein n=1 Tax=Hypocrea virens (strain Gv29-8 / FGSC 10586) TaxID=413071 RepID=G9N289_HYPVG|nr:uncharacterized protein TRIVIDRAFT_225073 [Trichoderma virens Gv29-8]EHK19203.1 hypothetical protein TRIVIDRAFT_225073 [Trichoderma virens Gv29-8]